jgi:hypothetical protein
MVSGLAFLAMAGTNFDVSGELSGQTSRITGGPAPGPEGARKIAKAISYTLVWLAAGLFALGLIAALRPRFRGFTSKKRVLRERFFTSESELKRRHRQYSYDDEA